MPWRGADTPDNYVSRGESDDIDLCGGQSTNDGQYHYQTIAVCLQEQAMILAGTGDGRHTPQVGWAYVSEMKGWGPGGAVGYPPGESSRDREPRTVFRVPSLEDVYVSPKQRESGKWVRLTRRAMPWPHVVCIAKSCQHKTVLIIGEFPG